MANNTRHDDVLALLRDPTAWPGQPARVDVIETHGALVFLAGDTVLKIKRPVRLPYLDFSTLEARRRVTAREIEINRPHAPEIYLDQVAITLESDGRLAIGGTGTPVEWAVRMRAFPQDALLSVIAAGPGISERLARELAEMALAYHRRAPAVVSSVDLLPTRAGPVLEALRDAPDSRVRAAGERIAKAIERALVHSQGVRQRRGSNGYIRRCHGDLHLGNIVLWNGRPLPFDAIEFDEGLATIDTLYDLAFLLMDLERKGARQAANTVLGHYLWLTGDSSDLEGLAALPLFLGLRACIRAIVALDRARLAPSAADDSIGHVLDTLALAERLLEPQAPCLVAIGGLSGTGKSTLAAGLAPTFGAAPGALHLRSDLERKHLAAVGEFDRLPSDAYTPTAAAAVYARLDDRARLALEAGHSVIVDAVFARPAERSHIAQVAQDAGARFLGLWLEAAPSVLRSRVAARTGDASDATPDVVDRQLGFALGEIDWVRIDSTGQPAKVLADARLAVSRAAQSAPFAGAI